MRKIIRLTESDITRIVKRVIREQKFDIAEPPMNLFKSACEAKLVPLGFEGQQVRNFANHRFEFNKKGGTGPTYVNITITLSETHDYLATTVETAIGKFEKVVEVTNSRGGFRTVQPKINSAVDEVVDLNKMIVDFARFNERIPKDKALTEQQNFKQILLKRGFKDISRRN